MSLWDKPSTIRESYPYEPFANDGNGSEGEKAEFALPAGTAFNLAPLSLEDRQCLSRVAALSPFVIGKDGSGRGFAVFPDLGESGYKASGLSWEQYEAVARMIGDRRVFAAFDRGALELRMPGPLHEQIAGLLASIVEILGAELDIPLLDLKSVTLKREDLGRAAEADQTYFLCEGELRTLRSNALDLNVDPAPVLAIEVDVTSPSLDRLGIFAALGVREIWRWRDDAAEFLELTPEGVYASRPRSRLFPALTAETVAEFVTLGRTMSKTRWHRRFREYVQTEYDGPRPL